MAPRLAGILVVALYLLVVCGSLLVMLWGVRPEGMGFWSSFSLGLGFIGLAQIVVQFLLIARFRRLSAPFGIDTIMYYHRQIGTLAVLLIVAHPVVLVIQNPPMASLLNPFSGDLASLSGVWSLIALVALVLLSFFRRQFRLGYEVWRVTHRLLALAAVGL